MNNNILLKEEKIQFGEEKVLGIFKRKVEFIVSADIPMELYKDTAKLASFDTNGIENSIEKQEKMFELVRQTVISILSYKNKKEKVEKFVNKLGMINLQKLSIFLNEYISKANADIEKKNS